MKHRLFRFYAIVLCAIAVVFSFTTGNVLAVPATPTGFTWLSYGATSLQLTWNAVSGATSYTVTRVGYGVVYSGANTNFTDTGLSCGTSYNYTLYASDASGNSGTTSFSATIPCNASGLSASAASASQINLSWTAASGATGYYIYRNNTYIGASGTASYSDAGLTCNTSYSYYVYAYSSSLGSSASASNTVSATTAVCPPATPTGFTVSGTSSTTLSLSWTASAGATSYTVVTYTGGQPIYSGAGTSVAVSGLTCNTSYSYSLTASNTSGTSANTIASGSTYVCPPATPTGVTATAVSSSQINVSWTAVTGATGYYIYRYGYGGYFTSGTTSYSDAGLSCNTSYSYQVVAYNAGGQSAGSTAASATTGICAPAAPSGLSAAAATGCSQINLSWTDNATNETGYYVYRNSVYVTALAANSTSYADTGLAGATSYSYYVTAYNSGGSANSNAASASTNSCVSSPTSPSSSMSVGTVISSDLGRPMSSLSWSGSANGFIVVRYSSLDGYHLVTDTASPSATDQTGIRCPATYTYYIYAYNTDTSLGTTDSSCTSQSPLTSAGASLTNKKCSSPVAVVRNMDYCTKGFFSN